MKVQIDEMWVTPSAIICKVVVWGSNGEWRQKRYASVDLKDVPEEVVTGLIGYWMDAGAHEDLSDIPLF